MTTPVAPHPSAAPGPVSQPPPAASRGLTGRLASVSSRRPRRVLLAWGLELAVPITAQQVEGFAVLTVEDDALIACFSDDVSDSLVREIAARQPLRVVFKDSGFVNDAARINAQQIFRELSPATEVKTI